jgi:hypothetical protein
MRIVLDSSIYLADITLKGAKFASLFDFARKTGAEIIVLSIVLEEVSADFQRSFTAKVSKAESAIRAVQDASLTGSKFWRIGTPNVEKEIASLRARLTASPPGTTVKLASNPEIDVSEVARRGTWRIAPANFKGEELRDVIIWLSVLQLAKDPGKTFFVTADSGFYADKEKKHPKDQILSDLKSVTSTLRIYSDIEELLIENALESSPLTSERALALINPESFVEQISAQLSQRLNLLETETSLVRYTPLNKMTSSEFREGRVFKVSPTSEFIEAFFNLTLLGTIAFAPKSVAGEARWKALFLGGAMPLAALSGLKLGKGGIRPREAEQPASSESPCEISTSVQFSVRVAENNVTVEVSSTAILDLKFLDQMIG